MARKTSTLTLKAAQSLWQDEKIREVRWCGQKKTIEKLAHPISVILSPLATTDNYYVIYVYVSILSFPCPRETMSFVFLPWKRVCCTIVVHVLATLL